MTTNIYGHNVDSAGNVAVDYVWGNFAPQPNDARSAGTPTATVVVNGAQNVGWTTTSTVASAQLDFTKDSHAIIEAGWASYPSYFAATGKFNITQVAGDGTTVRYECQNGFNAGDVVDITGCNTFNLSGATIAAATADWFTVTNSTVGSYINMNNGIVQRSDALTAADGGFVAGVAYAVVPNVLGLVAATAASLLTANDEFVVTTAGGATNSAVTVTAASRTAGSAATTITAASHGYVAGNKVTITSVDTSVNGTYTVVSAATNTFVVNTTATTVLALTGLTGSVVAVSGTVKSQSIAAGAASIAAGSAITITPWA